MKPIEDILKDLHAGDIEQLAFIFSSNNRIIVEAPAGYGKTRTMISKIAYQLATSKVPSPKKILALTFSVNAAYKIKKDVTEQIPIIINSKKESDFQINEKIVVSNYHGLCRRILKRYGYKIHENIKNIDYFTTFDDGEFRSFDDLGIQIDFDTKQFFGDFNKALKEANSDYLKQHFKRYNQIVIEKLVPINFIPFNGLLSLTIQIFRQFPNVKAFYQKLFPCIYIDEFQDTNIFSYGLIKQLINENSQVFLMGDSLQRIYGFIGAIPNLIELATREFQMEYICLKKNHRFKSNPQMLLLDYNIRRNAESLLNPSIIEDATIELKILPNQEEEAKYVFNKILALLQNSDTEKVAVLFRGGGGNRNTLRIIEEFDKGEVGYFYGLFSDEEEPYRRYHLDLASEFSKALSINNFSRKSCRKFLTAIRAKYENKSSLFNSLLILTEVFFSRIFSDYFYLDDEEKITLIKETFEGFGLKQFMEYVESKVIISTIHGAKGLEWDHILLPDMEQSSLPHWNACCRHCSFRDNCNVKYDTDNVSIYLDELSVFYVGFTRARKQVFFSASDEAINSNGAKMPRNLSCFLQLPGIKHL